MSNIFNEYPYRNFSDLNLDMIIKSLKELQDSMENVDSWGQRFENLYEEIKAIYEEIISGNFPSSIQTAFEQWMQENALDLVGELVKMVFFGITDSGYFVAYIPEGWDSIIFNTTGWDYESLPEVEYGHLILSY